MHLLESSTCFEHYPAHLQEVYVVIVYIQPCAPVKKEFFLKRCTRQSPAESDDTRGCIYVRCKPPEDEQDNARNM